MEIIQGSVFLEMLTIELSASHTRRDRFCEGTEARVSGTFSP